MAARFAARLLERLAGPELEAKLVDLALSDLDALPPDKLEALRAALREPGVDIRGGQRLSARRGAARRLRSGARTGWRAARLAPNSARTPCSRRACCIMAGAWVLMANLRDELSFFTAALEHGD